MPYFKCFSVPAFLHLWFIEIKVEDLKPKVEQGKVKTGPQKLVGSSILHHTPSVPNYLSQICIDMDISRLVLTLDPSISRQI